MRMMNTKKTDTRGEVDMRENILRKMGRMSTVKKAGLTFILLLAVMLLNLQEAKAAEALFTSGTGTWQAPSGVNSVIVEVWGGGGGGGGNPTTADGASGGGGGAYSRSTVSVTGLSNYAVVVGTGGSGGTTEGCTSGTDGGDSSFNGTTVSARGGIKGCGPNLGTGGTGGLGGATTGNGTVKNSGGQGESGNSLNSGQGGYGGSSAGTAANGYSGSAWSTITYPTANTPAGGGHGGNGGGAGQNGSPGIAPGGGGGGSGDGTRTGGAGANGQVRLTYTPPTTVHIEDDTNPPDIAVCTGTDNVAVDTFTLRESGSLDNGLVTSVTVTVNDWYKVVNTYVKDNDGANILCSAGTPTSNTISITGCNITVPAGLTTPFKIYFDMNGATAGTLTARVTNLTLGPNGTVGNKLDTSSAVISMNTAPPARITNFSATPQPGQVYMLWTNPTASDLQGAGNPHIMLRRNVASFPTTTLQGDLIMDDTAPVPGAQIETNDSTAINGVTYGYTVFSSDICGNWNPDAILGDNAATATPTTGCMRNQPSLGFDYMAKTITSDSGYATYELTIKNLDSLCSDMTFTLGAVNTNSADFTATTFNPSGQITLASGATTTVNMIVTAAGGKTSGETTTVATLYCPDHDDEASLYSPLTTIAVSGGAGSLMHNSNATGSPYWTASGGWGVSGGRYGQFVCETCHTKSAPNIKGVKGAITAPTWTTWASNGTYTVTSDFKSTTTGSGFGNDAGGHTSSKKVCEVCHSTTKYHRYATSGQTSTTHYNAQDCTKCHSHNVGFDPVCNSCHGIPPTVTSTGGPYGLADDPAPTGSSTIGSHQKHALNLGYSCTKCHNGYDTTMGEAQPKIDIGFSMFGKNGTGTIYGGDTEVTYTYRARNNTTVLMNDTRACSNLYCHGSTLTRGTNTTPQWTAIGSVICGSCHGTTAATTPNSGGHDRHAGTAGGGIGLSCADCHGGTVNGHMNGSVAWVLNKRNVRFGDLAAYKGVFNGSTGTTAPSSSYGSCSNVYCHSSVQGNGGIGDPATHGTPTWGGGALTCATNCHGDLPATGSHGKHVGSMGYGDCTTYCHTNGGDESAAHANGTINVTINKAAYGSGANYSQGNNPPQTGGYGTCSAVYCHGSYAGGNSLAPTWGGGAVACGACHKATVADPPVTGSHERHTGTGAGELHLTCNKCHGANGAGQTGHQDLRVQWNLERTDPKFGNTASYRSAQSGSTGAKAPSAAMGNCSSVYCHSNVQNSTGTTVFTSYATPTWGASGVSCGSCHANPNTSGSHVSHNTVYANDCTLCHTGAGSGSANHGNNKIDIVFNSTRVGTSGAYSQGSHTPGSGGFGYCSSTYCHGSLTRAQTTTMSWAANRITYDTCTICHGIPQGPAVENGTSAEYLRSPGANGTGTDTEGQSAATDKQVGAHRAHLATSDQYTMSKYSGVIACTNCHDVPAPSAPGGHVNSSRPAEVTFANSLLASANGSTPAYNSTTGRCTNVYCHGGNMPSDGVNPPITNATVTWNDTAYLTGSASLTADCDKCHLSPATSQTHSGVTTFSQCTPCHPHLSSNGTFSDPSKHINGILEADVSCMSCHQDGEGSRRNMTTEISGNPAWGHKKSENGVWHAEDCAVCHMEGDPADGQRTSLHNNGTLEFRDPDTGITIRTVSFGGTGAGVYTSGTGTASAATFSRNTGTRKY